MPTRCSPAALSDEQLASLARTYDAVSNPIWVHDLSHRCVYWNPPASGHSVDEGGMLLFDIVDHRGRTIAHLSTAER